MVTVLRLVPQEFPLNPVQHIQSISSNKKSPSISARAKYSVDAENPVTNDFELHLIDVMLRNPSPQSTRPLISTRGKLIVPATVSVKFQETILPNRQFREFASFVVNSLPFQKKSTSELLCADKQHSHYMKDFHRRKFPN